MKRFMMLCVAATLTTVTVRAQDWAKARLEKSPRHLEWVKVKHGDRVVNCFIAYPEVKEKATAVVVIHEIFGLTDWVRGVTDQLAEAGYIAIAPDLLSGAGPGGGGTAELGGNDAVTKAIRSLPQLKSRQISMPRWTTLKSSLLATAKLLLQGFAGVAHRLSALPPII